MAQRLETIQTLENINGAPIATGVRGPRRAGPVLSDRRAYQLLQSECSHPFAQGFTLYRLYGRAAEFAKAIGTVRRAVAQRRAAHGK